MEKPSPEIECTVIGAGIAGLLAATKFVKAGLNTLVVEKGRGVGGRMATRRRGEAVFDHGAQFFTVRDDRFERWVNGWREKGLVEKWYEHGDAGPHWRAVPGMTAIAKDLELELRVERQLLVKRVAFEKGRWDIETDKLGVVRSRYLVITAPVPQAMALLDGGGITLPPEADRALRAIRFHRCLAALAVLDRPSAIESHEGALKLDGEPLQWISDNYRKGVSPKVPTVTIHSTPAFAERHWDVEDTVRIPKLLEAAAPHLKAKVLSCECHRWGFSQPLSGYFDECFLNAERKLAIAGDGLAGGRVEGAALSGLAAAERLLAVGMA